MRMIVDKDNDKKPNKLPTTTAATYHAIIETKECDRRGNFVAHTTLGDLPVHVGAAALYRK